MTINIFVLKRDLNGENRSGAFLFLSGIVEFLGKLTQSQFGIQILKTYRNETLESFDFVDEF